MTGLGIGLWLGLGITVKVRVMGNGEVGKGEVDLYHAITVSLQVIIQNNLSYIAVVPSAVIIRRR